MTFCFSCESREHETGRTHYTTTRFMIVCSDRKKSPKSVLRCRSKCTHELTVLERFLQIKLDRALEPAQPNRCASASRWTLIGPSAYRAQLFVGRLRKSKERSKKKANENNKFWYLRCFSASLIRRPPPPHPHPSVLDPFAACFDMRRLEMHKHNKPEKKLLFSSDDFYVFIQIYSWSYH